MSKLLLIYSEFVGLHTKLYKMHGTRVYIYIYIYIYEGWNFNNGNYLFTTDTK